MTVETFESKIIQDTVYTADTTRSVKQGKTMTEAIRDFFSVYKHIGTDSFKSISVKDIIMYSDVKRSIMDGSTVQASVYIYLETYEDNRDPESIISQYKRVQKRIVPNSKREKIKS